MSSKGRPPGDRPASRAFAALEADGGWLTAEGISLLCDVGPKNIHRMLYKWKALGHVESRTIAQTDRYTRTEWRAVPEA